MHPPIRIDIITDIEEFHPTLLSWWNAHGWPGVPPQILPKLGIRAYELLENEGTRPIAAGFLYMDNSVGFSMLEWIVSNPDAAPRQAAKAIGIIAEFAKQEAKRLGYAVMFTSCKQPALARLLERAGFIETDRDVIHLCTVL